MRIKNQKSSYDVTTANKYISGEKPIVNVSSEIETIFKWDNNRPTEEISGYRMFFVQEGTNPFPVKFDKKPKLPEFLSEVRFEKLEAIEIRSKVYFRAESVQVNG